MSDVALDVRDSLQCELWLLLTMHVDSPALHVTLYAPAPDNKEVNGHVPWTMQWASAA
jgi:hypothetical protein